MQNNSDDKKLDWMYKGATSLVDREEYLLGRSVDKTLEQLNSEEKEKKLGLVPPKNHVEHECIPPSIRDFNKIVQAEQVDISAKLQEDPLVAIKKREEEARRQFLQNPVQLKKLQEALKAQQMKKKKKKRKKSIDPDSESDLDSKIVKKLQTLKGYSSELIPSKKLKKKSKDKILDTILMHKFNQLKDKLSQDDLNEILACETSDSEKEVKSKKNKKYSDSDDSSESKGKNKKFSNINNKVRSKKLRKRSSSSSNSDDSNMIVMIERKNGYKKNNAQEKDIRDKNRNRYEGYHSKLKSGTDNKGTKYRDASSDRSKYKFSDNEKSKGKFRPERYNEHRNLRREDSSEDDDRNKTNKEEIDKVNTNDSENDLESRILKKLRMLRDSVKSSNDDKIKEPRSKITKKPLQRNNSSSDSSSEECDAKDKNQGYRYHDSDSDTETHKPKAFGLVKSDGTKLALNKSTHETNKCIKPISKDSGTNKVAKKSIQKLSEEEKEKLRREMMKNAEKREKERSENLKKYREEDKREEKESGNYNKDFLRKELLKTTKDATVETRIKSNLNNIQRSSKHMDSHFSRRN